MSIRARLAILVAILMAISLTLLIYLGEAYIGTRQRLAEADAALREYELAADTGVAIAHLRLELLHFWNAGKNRSSVALDEHIHNCTQSFERWVASSQASLSVGIEDEAADVDAIVELFSQFERDLVTARRFISPGDSYPNASDTLEAPNVNTLFVSLLNVGVESITRDDTLELNSALDGVLLSMGTTPWIARIGPAQLASARATLSEISAVHNVRMRLLESYHLTTTLASGMEGDDQALTIATATLDDAVNSWRLATENYTQVNDKPAPPYFDRFAKQFPSFQEAVAHVRRLVAGGQVAEARTYAETQVNLNLEDELVSTLNSSFSLELEEARETLGRLSISTRVAGASGIGLIFAILVSALVLFATTARSMLSALEKLRAGTEIIGAGNFDHRVNLSTSDELGRLAANFDAMAEKLQEQVKLRKSIEIELLRSERLATLGQVIATVSHEIRNPLGTIQSAIYSLRKRLADADGAIEKTLDRAERSTLRCDRIIEELLDYTRAREPLRVDTVLDAWLRRVLEDYNFPAGVTVHQTLNSNAIASIDQNRIQGCIVNVLSNACQSMLERPGGPWLCELAIESRRSEERIEICITDTGPGIAPDVLVNIFEPMFSTRTFGVGLGLPIVKKNMEQHGGGIEIVSEVGRGTVATLWLAVAVQEELQHEESSNTGG